VMCMAAETMDSLLMMAPVIFMYWAVK